MTIEIPRPIVRRRRRRGWIIAITPLLILSLAWPAFRLAVAWWPYPSSVDRPSMACTWIEDRNGAPLAAFVASSGDWQLPLSENEISPHLFDAIVSVEDTRFFDHSGVDWRSAAAASWHDISTLSERRGASTITMQLYRLCDPAPRSLAAKLLQAVHACQIEQRMSKRQILVAYLNRAPFGGNLVGAGAASWRYFGRPCRELSLGQAALLAGIPQSPNRFRPDRHADRAGARRNHVLDRMFALGMISDVQRREATAEPIDAAWRPLPQSKAPTNGLFPTLTLLAEQNPGRSIHTTIDMAVQQRTAAATAQWLHSLTPSHITAAAAVVLDTPSAQCLAAVSCTQGQANESDAIDLTGRPRSSGSTLKPFIYAAAFDAGICTPRSILDDSPSSWAGYLPLDYDCEFRGPIPAAEALAQSRNIPALLLLSNLGVDRAVEVMRAMGLTTLSRTPQRYGLPLALGGADVTPMELAEAYATLARGGQYRKVSLIQTDNPSALGKPALRPEMCREALWCLADPDRTRNVFPAAAALAPAWKTGTSSGHRDAWCAAVTPRRTIVVWLGNPDGAGADRLIGQETAAPLALRILAEEDSSTGEPGFSPPAGFANSPPPRTFAIAATDPLILTLISPTQGQEIIPDQTVSADRQRIPLRARRVGDDGPGELWWFIDGQCIGHCAAGAPCWWPPAQGSHEVRAVDAQGHDAWATVRVR
jgi:penicillin-binding protein 1C